MPPRRLSVGALPHIVHHGPEAMQQQRSNDGRHGPSSWPDRGVPEPRLRVLRFARRRYPEMLEPADMYIEAQNVAVEPADFGACFLPTNGACFLAWLDVGPVGASCSGPAIRTIAS